MSCPHEVQELVRRITEKGDEAAWETLVKMYEVRLLGFLQKRISDRAACEDVFQDLLIEVWQRIARVEFEQGRCFEGFLFWLASVRATDWLRRQGRAPTLVSIYDLCSSESESGFEHRVKEKARNLSSLIESGERREREANVLVAILRECTQRMKEKGQFQRLRVFDLVFCKGMSNKDAAERLGMSRQAVKEAKRRICGELSELAKKKDPRHSLFPKLWE